MSSYCDVAPGHEWHGPYHDHQYGFPLTGDDELLERLALEINQAGLSWLTILKKRDAFHRAFEGFDPDRVAAYGDAERARPEDERTARDPAQRGAPVLAAAASSYHHVVGKPDEP